MESLEACVPAAPPLPVIALPPTPDADASAYVTYGSHAASPPRDGASAVTWALACEPQWLFADDEDAGRYVVTSAAVVNVAAMLYATGASRRTSSTRFAVVVRGVRAACGTPWAFHGSVFPSVAELERVLALVRAYEAAARAPFTPTVHCAAALLRFSLGPATGARAQRRAVVIAPYLTLLTDGAALRWTLVAGSEGTSAPLATVRDAAAIALPVLAAACQLDAWGELARAALSVPPCSTAPPSAPSASCEHAPCESVVTAPAGPTPAPDAPCARVTTTPRGGGDGSVAPSPPSGLLVTPPKAPPSLTRDDHTTGAKRARVHVSVGLSRADAGGEDGGGLLFPLEDAGAGGPNKRDRVARRRVCPRRYRAPV